MALTAMSLLWNAADLLSRMHQQAEERGNSTQVLSPDDFEDLLRLLLGSLQVCKQTQLNLGKHPEKLKACAQSFTGGSQRCSTRPCSQQHCMPSFLHALGALKHNLPAVLASCP